jgi:UDP-glucose 4-epimerase
MRIIVTGGAGFIGSHIVDAYVREGHDVTVVDDLSTGNRGNVNPRARFIELDIKDEAMKKVFNESRFDVVNHHAAQINVRTSLANPFLDACVNVLGSVRMLECAATSGVKRFIFASSGGAIYGEPKNCPITEDRVPQPMSPYAVAKLAAEHYVRVFAQLHGFAYVILRYSNVYGPRQISKSEAGVISIFINQILNDRPCFVNGSGDQVRDYIFVKDVVGANVLALNSASDVFNIGTSVETSVNQLVDGLAEVTGRNIRHEHRAAIPGEVFRNSLDYSKIRRMLNWQPGVSLSEGLRKTLEHFISINAVTQKISGS